MKPSDSKTTLFRALLPLLALVGLALYAPYTDAFTRSDVVTLALIAVVVLAIVRVLDAAARKYGVPITDLRVYPCGATVESRGWELAGFSHTRAPPRPGCPLHRAKCPTHAQNQG